MPAAQDVPIHFDDAPLRPPLSADSHFPTSYRTSLSRTPRNAAIHGTLLVAGRGQSLACRVQEGSLLFGGNAHTLWDTTEDQNPLGWHPFIFRPYIPHGAYWYEDRPSCPRGHTLASPDPHRTLTLDNIVIYGEGPVRVRGSAGADGVCQRRGDAALSRMRAWEFRLPAGLKLCQSSSGNGVCLPEWENRLIGFSADNSYQRHKPWRGWIYVERTLDFCRRRFGQPGPVGGFRLHRQQGWRDLSLGNIGHQRLGLICHRALCDGDRLRGAVDGVLHFPSVFHARDLRGLYDVLFFQPTNAHTGRGRPMVQSWREFRAFAGALPGLCVAGTSPGFGTQLQSPMNPCSPAISRLFHSISPSFYHSITPFI